MTFKERIKQDLKNLNTFILFRDIKPDLSNLDEVYLNNLNVWYLYNSDTIQAKNGNKPQVTNGILLNPENAIFCKTKKGFELTELDFIKEQINELNNFNTEKLDREQNKQLDIYKNHLIDKQTHLNPKPQQNNNNTGATPEPKPTKDVKDFFNQNEYLGDRQTIDIYKNCLSPFFIQNMANQKNQDGTINKLFYQTIKITLDKQIKHEIENNENYKPIIKDIKDYLFSEEILINEILTLLFCCYNHDQVIKIGHSKQFYTQNLYPLNDRFRKIYQMKFKLTTYKNNNEFKKAIDLKDYIVFRLDFMMTYFFENYTIQLKSTPIEKYINDLILYFNDLINTKQLTEYIEINKFTGATPEPLNPDEVESINFNANYFNANAYNLFNYLIGNYENKFKIKYINIWYFMRSEIDKNKYKFTITQECYTKYILEKFSVKISKFEKADYKYEDTEKPTLIQLEKDFRSLKKLI